MPLKIISESAILLVVDKPPGIAVWNEGIGREETIAHLLLGQFPELEALREERRYGIVHRLDKDTSGILLVARTKKYFEALQHLFKSRQIEKQYICLVQGTFKQDNGVIHTLLGRSPADRRKQKAYPLKETGESASQWREAITEWRRMQTFKDFTLLLVTPKTGRKHQIRAHMVSINHPIVGDKLYGFKDQKIPEGLSRQFLHAHSIKFEGGEFISELPKDLQDILENLQQNDSAN